MLPQAPGMRYHDAGNLEAGARIMVAISIRQLDRDIVELLKLRAVRNKRSLESEVRSILEHAARSDMDAKWERFFAAVDRLNMVTKPGEPLAEEIIRDDRDHGHREL